MRFSTYFPLRWLNLATLAFMCVGLLTACDEDDQQAAPATTYGPSVVVGSGSVRTYVNNDASGNPTEMGLRLTAAALDGLPATPAVGTVYELALPSAAIKTPFDHVSFTWNPVGHAPTAVYGVPHFDAHFYRQSRTWQQAITLDDPKGDLLPSVQMVPAGYQTSANSVTGRCMPQMGRRWTDPTSPEFQPGGSFSSTFIYGSYDGHVTFLEPMFTRAMLTPAVNFSAPIKQPVGYAGAGKYYPSRYAIQYDATTQEYVIALSDLFQIPSPLLP